LSATLRSYSVPLGIVLFVVMMVVPIPVVMLDIGLVLSISLSIIVLLQILALDSPSQFSSFPSLLLIATMLRLSLNVASTRLILLTGNAGKVIGTFGEFTVGGSLVVGVVVLIIITLVNLLVVTNGSSRTTEVNARFKLDAMPGKQMAIDADLAANAITKEQAQLARAAVAREADFFGTMDGAAKFVKGDAIAGIIITLINLIGGFAIGVVQRGMSVPDAAATYSLLSIGDGLVSQLPALVLSVATGILVTRSGVGMSLPDELISQLVRNRKPLRVAGAVIIAFGIVPGMPTVMFAMMGGAMVWLSTRAAEPTQDELDAERVAAGTHDAELRVDPDSPEYLAANMRPQALELVISSDMSDLVDPISGLPGRAKEVRNQLREQLGVIAPPISVRVEDAGVTDAGLYRFRIGGVTRGGGEAPANKLLALPVGAQETLAGLEGEWVIEPTFGLAALRIEETERAAAIAAGATVVDRVTIVTTHLAEVLRRHAAELLTLQQVSLLLDAVDDEHPMLVSLVSDDTRRLLLHRVLRELLEEGVSIRNLPSILDAFAATASESANPELIADHVRKELGGQIIESIPGDGRVTVMTLHSQAETDLSQLLRDINGTGRLVMDFKDSEALVDTIAARFEELSDGSSVMLTVDASLRRPIKLLIGQHLGSAHHIPVLAYAELPSHLKIDTIAHVGG
jgi:flagellar biosynthesis protein FlhA